MAAFLFTATGSVSVYFTCEILYSAGRRRHAVNVDICAHESQWGLRSNLKGSRDLDSREMVTKIDRIRYRFKWPCRYRRGFRGRTYCKTFNLFFNIYGDF